MISIHKPRGAWTRNPQTDEGEGDRAVPGCGQRLTRPCGCVPSPAGTWPVSSSRGFADYYVEFLM